MPVTLIRMISTALSNVNTQKQSDPVMSEDRAFTWYSHWYPCPEELSGWLSHSPVWCFQWLVKDHIYPSLPSTLNPLAYCEDWLPFIKYRWESAKNASLSIRTLDGLMGWIPGRHTRLLHPDPKHQFTSCILSPLLYVLYIHKCKVSAATPWWRLLTAQLWWASTLIMLRSTWEK